MRKALSGVVAVVAVGFCGLAQAAGSFTGRVGVLLGSYDFEATYAGSQVGDYSSGLGGILLGTGVSTGPFFVDIGVEQFLYTKQRDTDNDGFDDNQYYRSDLLGTLGFFLGDHFTVFGGLRHSTQGDGVFSDDAGYTADGPFIGAGFSARAGKKIGLGASLAYNKLTFKQQGVVVDNLDLNGLSLKLQLNIIGTPHAIFIRGQRFNGKQDNPGGTYDATEDYFNLGYQATFGFVTW